MLAYLYLRTGGELGTGNMSSQRSLSNSWDVYTCLYMTRSYVSIKCMHHLSINYIPAVGLEHQQVQYPYSG